LTYGVTYGEGDGPVAEYRNVGVVVAPVTDVVADTIVATLFASKASVGATPLVISVGDAIRVTARGVYSTAAIPVTLRIELSNATTSWLDTGAVLLAANAADRGWCIDALFVPKSSTSTECQGHFVYSTSTKAWDAMDMENAGAVALGILSSTVNIQVTWGAADPSNSISLRQLIVERIING